MPVPPRRSIRPICSAARCGGSPIPGCPTCAPARRGARWLPGRWRSRRAAGPGPVHLNLPFREPLVGRTGGRRGQPGPARKARPWHAVVTGASARRREGVVTGGRGRALPPSTGVIVAGAGAGETPRSWPCRRSWAGRCWPIPGRDSASSSPESSATADGISAIVAFRGRPPARIVLHLGERWASSVVNATCSLRGAGAAIVVVDPWERWTDPDREATAFVRADPTLFCEEAVSA